MEQKQINLNNVKYATDRLLIERTTNDDLNSLINLFSNNNMYYYIKPVLCFDTPEKIKNHFIYQNQTSYDYSIKLKSKNKLIIGQIGFYFSGKNYEEMSVFYYIGEMFQKQGYATEAAVPFVRELFERLSGAKILKMDYNDSNEASKKVAAKICDDILKIHPDYKKTPMDPSVDTYTFAYNDTNSNKDVYYYKNNEKQEYVAYPKGYLRKTEETNTGVIIYKPCTEESYEDKNIDNVDNKDNNYNNPIRTNNDYNNIVIDSINQSIQAIANSFYNNPYNNIYSDSYNTGYNIYNYNSYNAYNPYNTISYYGQYFK